MPKLHSRLRLVETAVSASYDLARQTFIKTAAMQDREDRNPPTLSSAGVDA